MSDVVRKLHAALLEQCLTVEEVFDELDVNKDHCVSYSELAAVLVNVEPTLTEQQCLAAFQTFDTDGNGYVSLPEFQRAIQDVSRPAQQVRRRGVPAMGRPAAHGPSNGARPNGRPFPAGNVPRGNVPRGNQLSQEDLADKVLELFRQFDVDGNGFIDYSELTSMLQMLDPAVWTPEKVVRLLTQMDANNDKRISFTELHEWATSGFGDADLLLGYMTSAEREVEAATRSALDLASIGRWPDVFDLLTAHQDSFVNVVGEDGYGLLHYAAEQGRTDVASALLDTHRAGPTVLTASGKSAVALASARGHRDTAECVNIAVAKVLIKWATQGHWAFVLDALWATPDAVNILPEGWTHRLLHYAAAQGKKEIVSSLVRNFGADPTLEGSDGRKPVDLAIQHGHVHIVEDLRTLRELPEGPLARNRLFERGGGAAARGAAATGRFGLLAERRGLDPREAPCITGDRGAPIDATLQQYLGMFPEPRWNYGDTDGEESDDDAETTRRRRGFLGFLGTSSPKSQTEAEQAVQAIEAMNMLGNLNGFRFEAGPIGVIADINYGSLQPANRTTTATKHYHQTLQTFRASMESFNANNCCALLLLGDQIDKRDKNADMAALRVIEAASTFSRPQNVGWLLGHHDSKHSRFFQMQRARAAEAAQATGRGRSPVSGSFCYEFSKLGEDGSSWHFIALDAFSAVCHRRGGREANRRGQRDPPDVDSDGRLHGAIGAKQLQWLDRRLEACHNQGHNVVLLCHSPLHCKKFLTWPPDRSYVAIIQPVQNYREVLDVIRKYTCVKLVLSGHDHRGAHYQSEHGTHHVSLPACVSVEKGGLSGALLWCLADRLLLDYLVAPGRSCARLELKIIS